MLEVVANNENKFILKRIRPGYNTGQNLINYIEKLKQN